MAGKMAMVLGFLLALGAASPAAAQSLLVDQWRLQTFLDTTGELEYQAGPGTLAMAVKTDKGPTAKSIFSLWQPLSGFDPNGKLVLTFEARQNSDAVYYLLANISSSPGANIPCARNAVELKREWQRHEITFPLAGLNADSVFEFLWEGTLKRGDRVEIRDIALHVDETSASCQLALHHPKNYVLLEDAADTTIRGAVFSLRRQLGGRYRITLRDDLDPDTPLKQLEGDVVAAEQPWELDVGDLPLGHYWIDLAITDQGGGVNTFTGIHCWKARESELNSYVKNGVFYRRGEPYIPLGLFHAGVWNLRRVNDTRRELGEPELDLAAMYQDIARHGINVVLAHVGPGGNELDEFAVYAAAAGLEVIPTLYGIEDRRFSPRENILGWYGRDESAAYFTGEQGREGRRIYRDLKTLPPVNAVFTADYVSTDINTKDFAKYGISTDVYLYDKYMIRGEDTHFRDMADGYKFLRGWLKDIPEMALGATPQAFIYQGPEPSPEQLRVQTYLGLVNGAKAFVYYTYNENYGAPTFADDREAFPATATGMSKNPKRNRWWLPDSRLWEEIGRLNGEINALKEFVVHEGEPVKAVCNNPNVDFALKRVGGRVYFIAVNMAPAKATAVFQFAAGHAFAGLFDDSALTVERGQTTLTFSPYEVKVLATHD